jgi:DNA-binding NarL/FixJ family response regulator
VIATQPLRASVRLLEGLLAAGAGDHEGARDCFEDAVDLFTSCRAPAEVARARLELSAALVALGRTDAAEREARAARQCLDKVGARAGDARTRILLKALGMSAAKTQTRHDQPLSARQLQVLRLVAEGLGDKEIANRLVLSEHTVHRHVANIYVRLGCSSRAAAVAHASRLGLL